MKISRKTWLILGFGAIIIIVAILFFNYQKQAEKRDSLVRAIDSANRALPGIVAQKQSLASENTQLAQKLAVAKSSIDQAGSAYLLTTESIEYGEEFFTIANRHNVQISSISASEPFPEQMSGVTYQAINVELQITGNLDGVTAFIHTLASSARLAGISIKSLSISGTGEEGSQFHISLVGYQYKS